jgi:hypothetical protein
MHKLQHHKIQSHMKDPSNLTRSLPVPWVYSRQKPSIVWSSCKCWGSMYVPKLPHLFSDLCFWRHICMESGKEEMEMPSVWSQVCLQNVASLAKEATTVWRMLEPMFRYFDKGRHWSLQHGLAFAILGDIQLFMEKTGHC